MTNNIADRFAAANNQYEELRSRCSNLYEELCSAVGPKWRRGEHELFTLFRDCKLKEKHHIKSTVKLRVCTHGEEIFIRVDYSLRYHDSCGTNSLSGEYGRFKTVAEALAAIARCNEKNPFQEEGEN